MNTNDEMPMSDNPSGMHCPPCRACGLWHCAYPEECGGMLAAKRAESPAPGDASGTHTPAPREATP